MRFCFNPEQDPGSRILENTVRIDDQPLDKNKVCMVYTKQLLLIFFLKSAPLWNRNLHVWRKWLVPMFHVAPKYKRVDEMAQELMNVYERPWDKLDQFNRIRVDERVWESLRFHESAWELMRAHKSIRATEVTESKWECMRVNKSAQESAWTYESQWECMGIKDQRRAIFWTFISKFKISESSLHKFAG